MERPPPMAARDFALGLVRRLSRNLGRHRDIGEELLVELVDPVLTSPTETLAARSLSVASRKTLCKRKCGVTGLRPRKHIACRVSRPRRTACSNQPSAS